TLGDFTGALRLMRWFRDVATTAGITGVAGLADNAATTVWEWEGQEFARREKLIRLRGVLLDAELTGNPHNARAARLAIADHEEVSGHFTEAAAAVQTVMLHLPTNDPSLEVLRDRVFALEATHDMQQSLRLAPERRPVLDDAIFLDAQTLERNLR
ncbi:MAG: hypothetical protein ACOYN3_08355, partial [Acidimicrobiia bacterium]